MQQEIEKKQIPKNKLNKIFMDYFGWKSTCDGKEYHDGCMSSLIHTHELSDIDNEFRRSIGDHMKKILQYKCDCGNHPNENEFKFLYESWDCCLGRNEGSFNLRFLCKKCKSCCGITGKIVKLDDILNKHFVDVNKTIEQVQHKSKIGSI
jgi:hypothetical protein